ncbi:MAG: prepilin-type N-terminal cleavage/methylation domain-containing protein [Patescibacteria group bacterium]
MTNRGFTMVEMMICVGILALVGSISLASYYSFRNQSSVSVASQTIAHVMRRAMIASEAMDGDSSWGVYVGANTVTLFKGPTYADRAASADRSFDVSGASITGLSEITFAKLTGYPSQTGTMTITGRGNTSATLSLNAKGAITY